VSCRRIWSAVMLPPVKNNASPVLLGQVEVHIRLHIENVLPPPMLPDLLFA
jgi:hypothetical protein